MTRPIPKVVTEYGVSELHGAAAEQRAQQLIAIARPELRDDLRRTARTDGLLR